MSGRGYDVVLIRAASGGARAQWPANEEAIRPTIMWRPNVGYDFGSWAVGIDQFPKLAGREHVLLVNDSLVGPFGDIDRMIDHFEHSTADVWAATCSEQVELHLQSFTLGFRRGVLRAYPLNRFWGSIREIGDKNLLIREYEIGLSRLIDREMLTAESFIPVGLVGRGQINPAYDSWDVLLRNGFPFVKRELLREDQPAALRERIVAEVRERWEQDPMQWFEPA
nr:rhamnan synthesis F family protein [Leucobacter ruminantium]